MDIYVRKPFRYHLKGFFYNYLKLREDRIAIYRDKALLYYDGFGFIILGTTCFYDKKLRIVIAKVILFGK